MSARDGLERVRAALDAHGVALKSHSDGSLRGRCPIHQGQTTTSLSVRHHVPRGSDRGRAQLRCFGGCDELDVLDLIGLGLGDLYDDPPPKTPGSVTREHVYLGPGLDLVGVVRRTEPKSFRPATPTATGWQAKSSDELKRLPYRLPAVVAAVANGEPVYVVEGEKDADALAAVGVTATCNAGGAGKWTADHAHWLKGADVVVWRDRDDPGRKHADAVVASLAGVASSVRVVEAAEGKDAADHLAAGRQLDEAVTVDVDGGQLVPARRLKVTKASEVVMRRLRWLWPLRIVLGGLTLLAGREGIGKSTVAAWLCAAVTRGELEGELHGQPRTVIYVNSEDARDYTIVPRLRAAGADLERVIFVDAVMPGDEGESSIVLPGDVDLLAEVVAENGAALVVLDAATSTIDSRLDGDRDRQMRQGLEAIGRGIGERCNCAVLGIVHFGKRESSDTGKLILGSIAWSQVARSVIAVALDEDSGNLVVSRTKGNLGMEPPSLSARIVAAAIETEDGPTSVGRIEWLGETDRDARDLLGNAEAEVRSELDEAREWLLEYLLGKGGSAPAGEVIRDGKRDGIAERTLQRARKKAGIGSRKAPTGWVWDLPEQGANPDGEETGEQGANQPDAVTSEDAKAPTDTHVHEPWRLGALAPSEDPAVPPTDTGRLCANCGQRPRGTNATVCQPCFNFPNRYRPAAS